jgi:hemolysin III
MSTKPLLRGHFHQAMFFIMLGACVPLLFRCETPSQIISVLTYTICALTMFGISALYHRKNWDPKKRLLWKKLDHGGIFLMIAGTFTPIAVLGLEADSSFTLLLTIWTVAFIGILQSIFFVNLPKILNSMIYLGAGYLVLPYYSELKVSLGVENMRLIIAGGVVYSLGALCYGLKWPKLKPLHFGYHEVFHLLVNFGAILHFVVIHSLIKR